MGILLLIATALIVYGISQPRYRGASRTVLPLGVMFVFVVGFFFTAVHSVREGESIETATAVVSGSSEHAVSMSAETIPVSTNVLTAATTESTSDKSPAPGDVSTRIELFDGSQRVGTRIDKLPEWVTSPDKNDEWTATVDSGSHASFDECEAELLQAACDQLALHLTALHPEAARWRPDRDALRNSHAVVHRVRETQVVRIDVANAVIREPLCREYWQLSLQPEVTEHLLSIYRPAISRERATWLAGGVSLATLLFGAAAVGLRMGSGRPRSTVA